MRPVFRIWEGRPNRDDECFVFISQPSVDSMSELGGHDVHDEAFIHAERLGHRYGGASSTQNLAGHAIRVRLTFLALRLNLG